MQFDETERGFSFSKEAPLDMRMDPNSPRTAMEILNKSSEKELGMIFRDYGEEPHWKKAAQAIVKARCKKKIKNTTQLVDLLLSITGFQKRKRRLHPATLIFQALRIAVNHELSSIELGLKKALRFLAKGGKMGVISFHSLEDRLTKNIFRDACHNSPFFKLLTKKPIIPTLKETHANRRSRSAKMRFIQRV